MSFFQPNHTSAVLSKASIEGILGVADSADLLQLEAGEDLAIGDPVYVSGNKFYKADNVTHYRVVGLIAAPVLATFLASAITAGKIVLSGLNAGSLYFLGNLTISTAVPSSGQVVRMGTAITSATFIINIEESILLS